MAGVTIQIQSTSDLRRKLEEVARATEDEQRPVVRDLALLGGLGRWVGSIEAADIATLITGSFRLQRFCVQRLIVEGDLRVISDALRECKTLEHVRWEFTGNQTAD